MVLCGVLRTPDLWVTTTVQRLKVTDIQRVDHLGTGFSGRNKVCVIVNSTSTYAMLSCLTKRFQEFISCEFNDLNSWSDSLAQKLSGKISAYLPAELAASQGGEGFHQRMRINGSLPFQ